jgi:hypothetical protein
VPRSALARLVVVCLTVAFALCVWGAVGWRRACRAEAEADRLPRAERFQDAQLLEIEVRGAEAAAQLALEGASDPAALAGE